jgi:hypothetical protein
VPDENVTNTVHGDVIGYPVQARDIHGEQVGELAAAILHVRAFLPPTDIRAEFLPGAFASNEPLLRHGDEILIRDALSAPEQYSLLDRSHQEAGRPLAADQPPRVPRSGNHV